MLPILSQFFVKKPLYIPNKCAIINKRGETAMENERNDLPEEGTPEQGYTPRPAYQVWLARIGLVVFIVLLAAMYFKMFRGGM